MTNMSYCRFQNTATDLMDCVDNFDDLKSNEEREARKRLVKHALVLVQKAADAVMESDQSGQLSDLLHELHRLVHDGDKLARALGDHDSV